MSKLYAVLIVGMAQYMCMESESLRRTRAESVRLHRRCDAQLAAQGLYVDSDLDVARRDLWGFAHNFSKFRQWLR